MADAVTDAVPTQFAGATLAEAQRSAVQLLKKRPSIDAAVDARRLLLHALGCMAIELVTSPERRLTAEEADRYRAMLSRRLVGEPVARIVGRRGFYGREFVVTPATLDPRPESETLIDAALGAVREDFPGGRGLNIVDIGTGTGCLLLTLLAELPDAIGTGVDISVDALAVATENGRRLGVDRRATWVEGRTFAGLLGPFGLLVSNPPYIASREIAGLDTDVKDFDPRVALDGGPDGLDLYREIATALRTLPGRPWIFLEIGEDQAAAVEALIRASLPAGRLGDVTLHRDMANKPRCVAMRLQN